jgi:hypothetical protein
MMRFVLAVLMLATACDVPSAFCSKRAECLQQDQGVQLEPDSIAVCAANVDAFDKALRANTEPECTALADADRALLACRAGLSCDDFSEADLGRKCEAEQDAFDLAERDVDELRGGLAECTALD